MRRLPAEDDYTSVEDPMLEWIVTGAECYLPPAAKKDAERPTLKKDPKPEPPEETRNPIRDAYLELLLALRELFCRPFRWPASSSFSSALGGPRPAQMNTAHPSYPAMLRTSGFLKKHLPESIARLVVGFMVSVDRDWVHVAKEGEYETLLDIPDVCVEEGLSGACKGGYPLVAALMAEKGAKDWTRALRSACEFGHVEIAELMIENKADCSEEVLEHACRGGNLRCIELIINEGVTSWESGLVAACKGGHVDVAELMIAKGAKYRNVSLGAACEWGHIEVVKLLIREGAYDWDGALYRACIGGHMEVARLMIDSGADNLVRCLECALGSGHDELARYLEDAYEKRQTTYNALPD